MVLCEHLEVGPLSIRSQEPAFGAISTIFGESFYDVKRCQKDWNILANVQ